MDIRAFIYGDYRTQGFTYGGPRTQGFTSRNYVDGSLKFIKNMKDYLAWSNRTRSDGHKIQG